MLSVLFPPHSPEADDCPSIRPAPLGDAAVVTQGNKLAWHVTNETDYGETKMEVCCEGATVCACVVGITGSAPTGALPPKAAE